MPAPLFLILTCFVFLACSTETQWPYAHVQDGAEILYPEEEAAIDSILAHHESRFPHKLMFVTTTDFQGGTIYTWSSALMDQLNLSDSGTKSVLFVVNPTSRQVRIEVSKSLEQQLPERITVQVAENSILPEMKNLNYYRGAFLGVRGITSYLAATHQSQ